MTENLNILFAVHHFPPRYTGGAEWRAVRTAQSLQRRGHTVRVLAVESITGSQGEAGLSGSDLLAWKDDEFLGIPVRRLYFDKSAASDPFRLDYDNPMIGDHLAGWFSSDRPDLFHLIGGYLISGRSLLAAWEAGVPSIVTLTDFWFLCPRITLQRSDGSLSTLPIRASTCARCLGEEQRRYRLPGKIAPGLMDVYWKTQKSATRRVEERMHFLRSALACASAVICPSQFLLSLFANSGFQTDRLMFSRQGRDFPATGLSPEKSPANRLRVGYLGQIAPLKGVHLLIQAARSLPKAPLTIMIYGDRAHFPEYARQLEALAAGDPRIQFKDPYRAEELPSVLRDIDVVVVPSVWYENSPNVILEAFAHQTPVIASDLGGMAELVCHEENGLLFTPGEAASLAQQINTLVNNPLLLDRYRQGIEPVRGETAEIDELVHIYRQAIAQPVVV